MISKEILEHIEKKILTEPKLIMNTGYKDLDYMLSGLEYGSVITIGARPAMGKTAFVLNILLNLLKQNKECLFCSLNMSSEIIIKRLISLMAKVNLKCPVSKESEIEKIKNTVLRIGEFNLAIAENILTVKEIEENIKKTNPEFVFIDQLIYQL